MSALHGGQSMISPLRSVLVRRPDEAFAAADPEAWGYASRPDLATARRQHDGLIAHLRAAGIVVHYQDEPLPGLADAVYVFDPVLLTDRGAILLRMGKPRRRGEEAALGRSLEKLGVPLCHRLTGDACAEGGDLLWLDQHTLAVGLGFRTNREGLRQLSDALAGTEVTLVPVELPYHRGPGACLHLLSLISIVDEKVAVVYPPLIAVPFWRLLEERGFTLIEVPQGEFATLGPNVLALAPGRCIMLQGNPITRRRLEHAGCEVLTYAGSDISLKAGGGPTCLTLPLLRRR